MDRPKLLILVSRFPYPLQKGDKLRAFHQIKELSKNYSITLVALSDRSVPAEHVAILYQYCELIVIEKITFFSKVVGILRSLINGNPFQIGYFFKNSCKRKVKNLLNSNDFHHIYCQLVRTSEYVKNFHGVPKTLDYMDALGTGMSKRIALQPLYLKWLFRMEADRLYRYEQRIFDYFEHHTIISKQDRDRIRHPESKRIEIIPNGISDSFFETHPEEKEYDLVFVGNMNYPPNIMAAELIVKKILPKLPNISLLLAGADPDDRVLRLRSERVDVSGWIDDIRSAYWKAHIFIAPMQIGTGLQNKLLEAMACSTPCITTTLANNALGAKNGKEILIADHEGQMVQLIRELLDNERLRASIAAEAKLFVRSKFNWISSVDQLIRLMENKHESNF